MAISPFVLANGIAVVITSAEQKFFVTAVSSVHIAA